MNYRILGKSNLQISEVSFGCMSLEDDYSQAKKILHKAIDSGIHYFDTADLYQKGENEKMVGKALRNHRKDVIIGTKVGNQLRQDGSGWDWNPGKEYILQAVESSLQRLQTDYIDLYQLHGGTINDPIDETIEAFEILKTQGKIRYYGISSIRPNVIKEWIKRSNMVSVMMQYSILDRRPEEECLDLLKEKNIGVLARGTLAKGLLAGKTPKEYLEYSKEEIIQIVEQFSKNAESINSKIHKALGYILYHPATTSAVVGFRSWEQLREVTSLRSFSLSEKEINCIQEQVPAKRYRLHR